MSDAAQDRYEGADTDFCIVSTTVTGSARAEALARALVEARLVACVQIVPIQSVYRWQDAIENSSEQLLLCKVRIADFEAVRDAIIARHDYALPEIVMTPIAVGSAAYLGWLRDMTRR